MADQEEDPWGLRPLDDHYTDAQLEEKVVDNKSKQARVATDGITMHYPNKKQKGNPNVVETKDFVSPLRGMNNMQVSRERPVTVRSMLEAIRYERNSAQLLRQVAITFRPAKSDFFGKSESYDKALRLIARRANGQYHNMFENTREANFVVLMCGFEENSFWVAIIIHLTPQDEGKVLADYISIIDPYRTNRAIRRRDIEDRHPDVQRYSPRYGHRPTGLVVFAIVCEFMRRVAVSKFLKNIDINPCPDLDMIFGPFQQNYNFDAYRRRMAAACANQAIEKSNYQGRLAIELPGYDENNPFSHDPIALAPPVYKEQFNSTSSKGQSGAKPPAQGGNSGGGGGGGDAGGPSGSGNEKDPIVLDSMDGVELDENDLRMESLDDLMELDNPGLNKDIRAVKMSYEAIRKPKTFGLNKVLGGVKKGVSKVQKGVKKQQSKLAKKYDSLSHKLAVGDYQAPLVHEVQSPIEEIQKMTISATAPQIPPVAQTAPVVFDPSKNYPQTFLHSAKPPGT
ncbi:hypothetical protein PG984_014964 [Apiospora sp. TS-2023a]